MRKYFGTDGIRGQANAWPMDAETALKVGMAAGRLFTRDENSHRVVIGKDTRLSGYMIESALVAGFLSVGMNVFQFGPLPTPAVAMLTRSLRADLGVMISASHNPFADNGIKLFGPDGYKLSDEQELEIERMIEEGVGEKAASDKVGRAKRIEDAQARYIEFAKRTFPKDLRLEGIRVVVDCANGAAYKVAPAALWELGAEVFPLGVEPDGLNVNDKCGSTAPERLCERVRELRADVGIALDGDADRVILVDEKGQIIDGDQVLALIAESWSSAGRLRGSGVVATVMSNLGLERYLNGIGLDLIRTKVGDRYVVECMRRDGFNIGGEQSGHIVLNDFTTTGDGLIAALQVLGVVVASGRPVSEVCARFQKVPQLLKSVRYSNGNPLEASVVKAAIDAGTERLGSSGRVVIRASGTEPVIRVMAEGDDETIVRAVVDEITSVVKQTAATAAAA
ncbi:phosphoglucosamine mutase [Rhodoligotrophos appendicifer]|uniref:phosphoglucosamine mutase n=1 Tax=Rhodoligotrophos appendicifer TaxID=987056 RepID=UPI001186BE3B|nr:phosphoglucosamine mutase [Rhodoligotrophos appendicifer]